MVQPPVLDLVQPVTTHSASPGIVCRICLDGFEELNSKNIGIRASPRGHLFCEPCITRAVALTPKFPLCRQDIEMQNLISIYI